MQQWLLNTYTSTIHLKDYLNSISNYVSVAGSNKNRFDH